MTLTVSKSCRVQTSLYLQIFNNNSDFNKNKNLGKGTFYYDKILELKNIQNIFSSISYTLIKYFCIPITFNKPIKDYFSKNK